jgi:YVTN family beta-propeller protein
MKKGLFFILITIGWLPYCGNAQKLIQDYKISRKIHVEGDGGWDYLKTDASGEKLFVSHGTVVQVVDISPGKVIATIPDLKGVHGIALAEKLNKGYITNGKDSSVTVFDLKTYKTLGKISVTGKNPDCILFDPFSGKIFTFNGRGHNVTVIDPKKDKVIKTIPLEGKPEFAVSDGAGKIYVNIEDKSTLVTLDAKYLTFERSWPLSPGEHPSGLAIDLKNKRVFSVCENQQMIVMDPHSGQVVGVVPIGEGSDGTAYDPDLQRAYSSNGEEGTLTIVSQPGPDSYRFAGNIATQVSGRTITLNPKNHHLYIPAAEFGKTPEPTTENPNPRPLMKPGSFVILDIEPGK